MRTYKHKNIDSCGGTGGCYGATAEIAFEYIASTSGFVQEFQYPYQSYYGAAIACRVPEGPKIAIDGYVKLPENNYTALMNAIAQVNKIIFISKRFFFCIVLFYSTTCLFLPIPSPSLGWSYRCRC